jgi:hypothetical protein
VLPPVGTVAAGAVNDTGRFVVGTTVQVVGASVFFTKLYCPAGHVRMKFPVGFCVLGWLSTTVRFTVDPVGADEIAVPLGVE